MPDAYTKQEVQKIVAGAIYDFAGRLTTREKPITLGSSYDASPAAEACQEFLDLRGLGKVDAQVIGWDAGLQPT